MSSSTAWFVFLCGSFPTMFLYFLYATITPPYNIWPFGNWLNFALSFFQQISELALIACIHFWTDYYFLYNFHFPSFFVKIFFYGIYLAIFILSAINYVSVYSDLQFVTPTVFRILFGKSIPKNYFSPPLNIKENHIDTSSGFIELVLNLALQNKAIVGFSVIIFAIWLHIQFTILYLRISKVIKEISKNEMLIASFPSKILGYGLSDKDEIFQYNFNIYAKIFHGLAAFALITNLLIFVYPPFSNLTRFSTLTYSQLSEISLLHYDKRKSNFNLELARKFLPPGRYWLDNRTNPTFPAVHSGIEAFCAYNKENSICHSFNPKQREPVTQLPNVVLLTLNSMTPVYNLLAKDFISEHVAKSNDVITNKTFFDSFQLQKLAQYQKLGIAFSGMSSLSSNPDYGWHSLMTGVPPSQTFSNLHDSLLLYSDDLPSFFHSGGYTSLYFSGRPVDTTDMKHWVWRRSAHEESMFRLNCNNLTQKASGDKIYVSHLIRECTSREILTVTRSLIDENRDFPTWFDKTFVINKDNIHKIKTKSDEVPNRKDGIYPDRITTDQFITKWQENRKKPIFAHFDGIATTKPYEGHDFDKFYEPFDQSLPKSSPEYREQRYMQMMKYADKYQIGAVLDWLKTYDNNTIFVITAKSGAKDAPIQTPGYLYGDGVEFSGMTDSFFTTGALIGYLGDDEKIKEIMKIKEISGKTLKIPTDHNDLIYTIEDIICKINNTEMPPTYRRSRNLIDLASNLTNIKKLNNIPELTDWTSYSLTTYLADYREGRSLLKTHTADSAGSYYYESASFPTSMKRYDDESFEIGSERAKDMFYRMHKYIKSESYLIASNTLYHVSFNNRTCVQNGYCEFPTPKSFKISSRFFVGIYMLLPLVLVSIFSIFLNVMVVMAPMFNIGRNTTLSKRRQSFYEL